LHDTDVYFEQLCHGPVGLENPRHQDDAPWFGNPFFLEFSIAIQAQDFVLKKIMRGYRNPAASEKS